MITLAVASFFAILASQLSGLHRRRGRHHLQAAGDAARRLALLDGTCSASRRRPLLTTTWSSSSLALCWRCCASSIRRSAACCWRSARTSSAPRRSATAPSSTAPSPTASARWSRRSPARCYALWLRYTGPDTTLDLRHHDRHPADGGDRRHGHDVRRGDRRDAVRRRAELPAGPDEASPATRLQGMPLLPNLFHPDRWLLWLGVLFVVCVYWFPSGIVGKLRALGAARSVESPLRPSRRGRRCSARRIAQPRRAGTSESAAPASNCDSTSGGVITAATTSAAEDHVGARLDQLLDRHQAEAHQQDHHDRDLERDAEGEEHGHARR